LEDSLGCASAGGVATAAVFLAKAPAVLLIAWACKSYIQVGWDSLLNFAELFDHSHGLSFLFNRLIFNRVPSNISLFQGDSCDSPVLISVLGPLLHSPVPLHSGLGHLDSGVDHDGHANVSGDDVLDDFALLHDLVDEAGHRDHLRLLAQNGNFARHVHGLDHDDLFHVRLLFPDGLLDATVLVFGVYVAVLVPMLLVDVVFKKR